MCLPLSPDFRIGILPILATMTIHCKPLRNPKAVQHLSSTMLNKTYSDGHSVSISEPFNGQNNNDESNTTHTMTVLFQVKTTETVAVTKSEKSRNIQQFTGPKPGRKQVTHTDKYTRIKDKRTLNKRIVSMEEEISMKKNVTILLSQAKASTFQALVNFVSVFGYSFQVSFDFIWQIITDEGSLHETSVLPLLLIPPYFKIVRKFLYYHYHLDGTIDFRNDFVMIS